MASQTAQEPDTRVKGSEHGALVPCEQSDSRDGGEQREQEQEDDESEVEGELEPRASGDEGGDRSVGKIHGGEERQFEEGEHDDEENDDEDDDDDNDDEEAGESDEDDRDRVEAAQRKNLERLRASDRAMPLHEAGVRGDVDAVRLLLQSGHSVDEQDDCGRTALSYAVQSSSADVVAALLEGGAAVDAWDNDGKTILSYAEEIFSRGVIAELLKHYAHIKRGADGETVLVIAAKYEFVDMISELIRNGTDVNAKDSKGETALMAAAGSGSVDTIAELIRNGADVNAQDDTGETALMREASWGSAKAVAKLLTPDACVNAKNKDGHSALTRAAERGDGEIIAALVSSGADVNARDNDGVTALMQAVDWDRVDTLADLLRNGADVNARNNAGETALMRAAWLDCVAIIPELIRHGADVNAEDNSGATALMHAATSQHGEVIVELVRNGAVVNAKDGEGVSALMRASKRGFDGEVAELLSNGADVDATDCSGVTASMLAAKHGHFEVVCDLLQAGASVDLKSSDERTALAYAAEEGHLEIVAELLRRDAVIDGNDIKGKTVLGLAAKSGHRDVAAELLRYRVIREDASSFPNAAALFLATSMGDTEAMMALIINGTPIDGATADGRTALFYAAECGQTDAARILLEHGASVRAKLCSSRSCWDGYTPLIMASRAGNMDIVEALVNAGAPVNVCSNTDGETALISAVRWDYFAGVQLLLAHGEALRVESVSDDECPLLLRTLATMRRMCADAFEYKGLCAHVLERLQGICDQLQQLEPALVHEGTVVSLTSIIFRYCSLLLDIKKRHRALARFIASRAISGKIQGFHEELDHFVGMVGLEPSEDGARWRERWNPDLSQLQTRYQDLLSTDDALVSGSKSKAQNFETAILLQNEIRLRGEESGQATQENIARVLERFLRVCAIDAPVVPEWFVSRDDVEFHSWNIVRSEARIEVYAGKWRNTAVMVETADIEREQFDKAASQWLKQSHPNVVKLFGACHIGTPFLFIYESVPEGRPLHDFLSDEANRGSRWKCLYDAALGLQYLHNRGVVHGNLRGENIIVGSNLVSKLCGVHEDARRDVFDERRSTFNWQSPELVRQSAPVSIASDMFAFGMCVWEAAVLELPWRALSGDEIVCDIMHTCVPERPENMPDVPWELITKMCARDPSERVGIAYVVNRLKHLAVESESKRNAAIAASTALASTAETPNQSVREHAFEELEGATISKALEAVLAKCERIPEAHWMVANVAPALEHIFSLLQEHEKTAADIEVLAFCRALSRFQRYLRTAVSERSVFELARSRQVAASHHVIYSELDRVLDALEVPETDSIRAWRSDGDTTDSSGSASPRALHDGSDNGSGPNAVQVNYLNAPSTNHALWTQAGLATESTSPDWFLSLRELSFSESDQIGQGAFGAVFKGFWLDTPVVVKFMGYEEDRDMISTDLLLHEVRVWHRLNHPHVLKLYGACHLDKRYFVCELASNGDLTKYLQKRREDDGSEHLMWQKMYEAALGLQYLHGQNVAHNDLKCDNIMVGMDGKAKLIDFGLSCILNEAEIQIDVKKMGAVNWRSPEYLAGGRPSFASDVYSFAMCIIEVVSGDFPWGHMPPVAVKFQVKRGRIPSLPASMSEKQRNLIELMTKKEPSDRVKIDFVVNKLREIAEDEKGGSAP